MKIVGLVLLVAGLAANAWACSLCASMNYSRATLREDLATARLVIFGALANARVGADGKGATDLQVETVLKSDPILAERKVLTLPRFVPVDPKSPPKFLVFCDVINGEIAAYRGSPVKSGAVVEYLQAAAALPADRVKQLLFYFRYLDHPDAEIAQDAFLEFAKTQDADIARVASKLDPARLKKLIIDPATPPERLGLFAYLLGASGGPAEALFLSELLTDTSERLRPAFGGIVAGLIQLDPKSGWARTHAILSDKNRPFSERLAALGALRFFHGANPTAARDEILRGLAGVLTQGDLADLAVEDLRRWQWWDLTKDVLALFGKPTHSAPIVKRAILRYALSCPLPEARELVARVRGSDPELVQDVEESLRFEKPAGGK